MQAIKTILNFQPISSSAIGAVWLNVRVIELATKRATAIPLTRFFVGNTSTAYAYGEDADVDPKKYIYIITKAMLAFPQPANRKSIFAIAGMCVIGTYSVDLSYRILQSRQQKPPTRARGDRS